jgi:putative oxidoreductase
MLKELLKKVQKTSGGLGLLILRIVLGVIFFKAGSGKLFGWFGGPGIEGATQLFQGLGIPAPHAQAIFVGCTELLGGSALILGFLSRLAAIPLAITMVVAIFTAHRDMDIHFYYALVILSGLIALMDTGAGKISVDHGMSRQG